MQSIDLDFSGDFKEGFDLANSEIPCILITGKAGTGKSTLLKYFVEHSDKQIVVLSFTGIAAINVGGVTIHSFFKFPLRPITNSDIKKVHQNKIYKLIDTIVIDEISMVRADLLDGIDLFLRKNGKDSSKPFGGVQMVFFGDLYQLEPIVTDEEKQFFDSYYNSPWFFDAKVIENINFRELELRTVFRQNDERFIDLLDSVRIKTIDHEKLNIINGQYDPKFSPSLNSPWITLTATNKTANRINHNKLSLLSGDEYLYEGHIEGNFPKRRLPAPTDLKLKEDAQVMFVKNDFQKRWVNGTIGKVNYVDADTIKVTIENDGELITYSVDQVTWEINKYTINKSAQSIDTEIIGSFTQYPLKLAWAVTIHKSQGLTFDKVVLNLGTGAFTHGQTYVALSRCRSLEGIVLSKKIHQSDIIVNPRVKEYYEKREFEKIYQPELSKPSTPEIHKEEKEQIEVIPVSIIGNNKGRKPEPEKVSVLDTGESLDDKISPQIGIFHSKSVLLISGVFLVTVVSFLFGRWSSIDFQMGFWKRQDVAQSIENTPSSKENIEEEEKNRTITITSTPQGVMKEILTIEACVTAKNLSVRSGPGTKYSVLDYIHEGDCIEILSKNRENTWVLYKDGWVSIYYLDVKENAINSLPVSTPIAPVVVPTQN